MTLSEPIPSLRARLAASRALLLGAVLAIGGAAGSLWYGEQIELERVRSLKEGAADAVEVGLDMVRPELEGKLVHVAGPLAGQDPLRDDNLGVAVPGLRLHRTVEMFQWEEHEDEVPITGTADKKKVKSYVKKWAPEKIASRSFEPGHDNPSEMQFVDRVIDSERASLGPYLVNTDGIRQIANFETLAPTQEMIDHAPRDVQSKLRLTGQSLYLGRDPGQPEIGDCRIALQLVPNQPVAILAEQHGAELVPHKARAGGQVFAIQPGAAGSAALLEAADAGTGSLTWGGRGVALVLLGFAFTALLAALRAGGRAAPRLGRFVLPGLVGLGASAAALLGGAAVGAAWMHEKPIVSGVAFGIAVAGLVLSTLLVVKARRTNALARKAEAL